MEDVKSPRMKRVDEFLKLRGSRGATTKELEDYCGVAAARDYVRRLRQHGRQIETREEGTNANGARVVRYVLPEPKEMLF